MARNSRRVLSRFVPLPKIYLSEARNLRVAQLELPFPPWTMRPAILRWILLMFLGVLLAANAAPCHAQQADSISGPLPVFEFHSGFWVNLHHFLYHEARARMAARAARDSTGKNSGPTLKQSPGAVIALSAAEQRMWDEAVAYYSANYADKDMLINIDLILLKN